MKPLLALVLLTLLVTWSLLAPGAAAQESSEEARSPVTSRIEKTDAGELVLVHEVRIDAPVSEVWKAHTTVEGWTAWSSPVAEIDLRVGGTIKTHYVAGAKVGDAGTNVLHIVNYVPERVLTLRAVVAKNWPDVMKEDADKLSNVILFEALGDGATRLTSYGIGYRDLPELERLLGFFETANAGLYLKLIEVLEEK